MSGSAIAHLLSFAAERSRARPPVPARPRGSGAVKAGRSPQRVCLRTRRKDVRSVAAGGFPRRGSVGGRAATPQGRGRGDRYGRGLDHRGWRRGARGRHRRRVVVAARRGVAARSVWPACRGRRGGGGALDIRRTCRRRLHPCGARGGGTRARWADRDRAAPDCRRTRGGCLAGRCSGQPDCTGTVAIHAPDHCGGAAPAPVRRRSRGAPAADRRLRRRRAPRGRGSTHRDGAGPGHVDDGARAAAGRDRPRRDGLTRIGRAACWARRSACPW